MSLSQTLVFGHLWQSVAIAAVLITLTSGRLGPQTSVLGHLGFAIGIFLGLWLIAASGVAIYERAGQVKAASWPARLRSMPGGFWGMILAHAGVGVFCIGVACVKALEIEVDAALGTNQSVEVGGYTLESVSGVVVEGTATAAGNQGVMGFAISVETMVPIAEANGYSRDIVERLADIDSDGDGTNDALSIAFVFTSVPASLL
jgi:cytochrome c biogenesis factor